MADSNTGSFHHPNVPILTIDPWAGLWPPCIAGWKFDYVRGKYDDKKYNQNVI